jgi:four helix bundle protein
MNIAHGSLEECRYYLILTGDLGYRETAAEMAQLEEVSKLFDSYAKAIVSSDS